MSAKEAVLKLRIDTVLGDMSKAINGLQQGLEKGVTKIDVGTALGKSMSKNIQTFREEYNKFSQLTAGGTQVKVGNSKEAIQSGEKLIKVYRDIQAQIETMGGASTENLKKLFPDSFDSRINGVKNSLKSLQSSILALDVKQTALTEATNEAARLEGELNNLKGQLIDTTDKVTALENAEKALAAVNTDQTKAEEELRQVGEQAEQVKAKFEQLRQEFVQKIDLNAAGVKQEIDSIEKEINELITKRNQLTGSGDNAGAAKIQKDIDAKTKTKGVKEKEYKKLTEASMSALNAKDLKTLSKQTQYAGINPKQIEQSKAQIQSLAEEQKKVSEKTQAAEQAVAAAKLKTKDATDQQKAAQDALDAANNKNEKTQQDIEKTTKAYEQQTNKVNQLTTEITNMQTKMSTKGLADLKDLIPGFDEARLKTTTGIQGIIAELQKMDDQKADKVREELEKIAVGADTTEKQIDEMKGAFKGVGDATAELSRAEKDLNMLKSRLEYFFGITNSIQLFKRAVTSALNVVKELDKTMTEAAVVTEFDIGDMWNKLPEYSKEAQNLGVSINGMYQATTLYYQQGLKNNEAMALGVETMKMGKIAAMDSTEATKAMTAALRGFNMELNETSATRVNDVYSQLAAVTAADTNQIATAMEKTASIAASANMEFETTAALLAQIIETTQEAPETAGTAMKTIIARFAEVKSLREQGLNSGEDDEGEIIDVNKIQTALRTVGISMEGFFNGTEGLDSILLKLSEKWGTLDFETQRYIATMAAGSRQQSRFIAMMSDYGRTTELVEEAQNSAGASQKQFEKTQESLATSLTKLKNAWDQFLMGLTNNGVLKFAIDSLTFIIEGINKLTDAISGGNGLTKSLVSLIGVVGALKGGKALFNSQGVNGLLGGLTGQKSWTETRTQSKNENGEIVETVVRNPVKQGEKSGMQAGNGFVRGFTKAVKANKAGEKGVGAFMKNTFTSQISSNKLTEGLLSFNAQDNPALGKIQQELKDGIISAEEASKKFQELGVDTSNLGKNIQATIPNFKAMGQAMMGAGAAVSLLGNLFEKMGMEGAAKATKILSSGLIILGTAFTILAPIVETVGNKMVEKGIEVSGAWWWVTLIAIAVAATIAAFVALGRAAKNNSIEGRMKANQEATEKAKTAAEEAKQAYDTLLSDRSEYDQLQDTLEGLTKGTKEWKEALLDTNAQVLELISKYPELAKYMNIGKNGEITIDEEGWDFVENQAREDAARKQTATYSLQAGQIKLEKEKIEKDATNKMSNVTLGTNEEKAIDINQRGIVDAILQDVSTEESKITRIMQQLQTNRESAENIVKNGATTYKAVKNLSEEDIQKVKEAYHKNPQLFEGTDEANKALEELAIQLGVDTNDLKQFKDTLVQYAQDIGLASEELQAKTQNMIMSSLTPEEIAKESTQAAMGFASKYTGLTGQENKYGTGKLTRNEVRKATKADGEDNWFDKIAADLGVDLSGKTKKEEMQAVYDAIYGEGKSKGMNKQELKDAIANYANSKYSVQQTKDIAKVMESRTKDQQKIEGAILQGDISGLSQKDLEKLKNQNIDAIIEAYGITGEQASALKADYERLKNIADQELAEYTKIKGKAKAAGAKNFEKYFQNASNVDIEAYTKLLKQGSLFGGAEALDEGFSAIFEKYGQEKADEIIAMMDTFDWTKEGAGEQFLAQLEQMGIILDENDPNMKNFISNLKKLDAYTRDYDVSKVINDVTKGLTEARDVGKQEELTNEQYSKFLKDGIIKSEDWQFTGTGWKNISNGMIDLVDALKENTLSNYRQEIEEAKQFIEMYDNVKETIDQALLGDWIEGASLEEKIAAVTNYGEIDEQQAREYLTGGYDLKLEQAKSIVTLEGQFDENTINLLEEEKWENPYDKSYNTQEKINTLLREREKIELRYEQLLNRQNVSAEELLANRKKQLSSLEQEKILQSNLKQNKAMEIQGVMSANSKYSKYVTGFDANTGEITIDWDAINKITDKEEGESVEKYISKLEELRDQWRESDDKLNEIEGLVDDIYNQGKDEYLDLENRVIDALVKEREKEIDALNEINNSINDTNSKILESMQESIEEYRQNRDNEKTEDEIEKKQRRLAYLQQDSSGANALEILELQREIKEEQESYTDQLIDQKISELQKQNDEAAEQRAEQIQLMNDQLEQDKANGEIAAQAQLMLSNAFGSDGKISEESGLFKLLWNGEEGSSLSSLASMEWVNELERAYAEAASWSKMGSFNTMNKVGDTVTFTNANGQKVTGVIDQNGNVTVDGKTYKGETIGISGYDAQGNPQWSSSETVNDAISNYKNNNTSTTPSPSPSPSPSSSSSSTSSSSSSPSTSSKNTEVENIQKQLNRYLSIIGETQLEVDGIIGSKTKAAYDSFVAHSGQPGLKNGIYDSNLALAIDQWIDDVKTALQFISDNNEWRMNVTNDYTWGSAEEKIVKKIQATKDKGENSFTGKMDKAARQKIKSSYWERCLQYITPELESFFQFETGGLADFTGPAWLDGTKSRPEYVLNADQTKAFFTLIDVLSSLKSAPVQNTQNSGEYNYDIDINVESIGSDYDVEQISRKIEEIIVDSSRYRNNNIL